jgi:hypothetical protein
MVEPSPVVDHAETTPPPEPESEKSEPSEQHRVTTCRYPGCGKVIVHDRTYWGRTQKFCGREHRKKMELLRLRLEYIYEKTRCPFPQSVLEYIRLITGGIPP